MPSRRRATPDAYVPPPGDLIGLVRRRGPGASLRELCADLWPDLAWTGGTGSDSATGRVRLWQAPYTRGCGNRAEETTAALWLRDRLQELIEAGQLRHGPRRRDEVDLLASLSYAPVIEAQERRATHG